MGRTLDFTLDCSLSTNVMSHRRTLVHSQLVPPNETKVTDCPETRVMT